MLYYPINPYIMFLIKIIQLLTESTDNNNIPLSENTDTILHFSSINDISTLENSGQNSNTTTDEIIIAEYVDIFIENDTEIN